MQGKKIDLQKINHKADIPSKSIEIMKLEFRYLAQLFFKKGGAAANKKPPMPKGMNGFGDSAKLSRCRREGRRR